MESCISLKMKELNSSCQGVIPTHSTISYIWIHELDHLRKILRGKIV